MADKDEWLQTWRQMQCHSLWEVGIIQGPVGLRIPDAPLGGIDAEWTFEGPPWDEAPLGKVLFFTYSAVEAVRKDVASPILESM